MRGFTPGGGPPGLYELFVGIRVDQRRGCVGDGYETAEPAMAAAQNEEHDQQASAEPVEAESHTERPAWLTEDHVRPKYHDAHDGEDQDANGRDQGGQREKQEPIRQPADLPGDIAPGKPFGYRWWLPRHLYQFASC